MIKKFALILASIALSSTAYARCTGYGSSQHCTDDSGNSYNVRRIGNTTYMDGTAADGSTWSQTTRKIGSTTYHDGVAADGNSWSGTTRSIGGTTYHDGYDSRGNSYNKSCTRYGCN